VAIIGILAAIAVPSFLSYRNKSRVASVVGTAEGLRAALANYAADSSGSLYPTAIADWGALYSLVITNGNTLKSNMSDMHITSLSYSSDGSDYILTFIVAVPDGTTGKTVRIAPAGIDKQ
jgi:type II secretory pathway pseudopilin PulG